MIDLARACVGACSLAAAELAARRTGRPVPRVVLDDGALATAFVSERHLLIDGRATVNFAPLSRFWRTADGWLRTHANYPHHRTRLLAALGLGDDASVERVAALLAERSAAEAEETVYAAGGLAVALRTTEEWAAHPQAVAIAGRSLLDRERLDKAAPRSLPPLTGDPLLPASGLRVLDLTRVTGGPVATRTLALFGADVLRVDAPQLPEDPEAHADTGFGKRSTRLDLTGAADRRAFEDLLAGADVVVTGYRPGALDRFGLTPEALASRRPGLVVAQLSAWGAYGPWGERRGFDSVVQVATGIAVVEGSVERPGGAARAGPGPRHGLSPGGGRAARRHRAAGRGRHARAAGGARPDRALADAGAPARAHRGHGDVRRREPGALAHGDRQCRGTAAARAAATASPEDPSTGSARPGFGVPTRPSGGMAEAGRSGGMTLRQLFSWTCPDLSHLAKIMR